MPSSRIRIVSRDVRTEMVSPSWMATTVPVNWRETAGAGWTCPYRQDQDRHEDEDLM